MKHQEIMELIDHFAGSGLQSMKLAQEGVSLELHRGAAAAKPEVRSAEIMPVPEEAPEAVDAITAPLAGIFYAAPAPDQPPWPWRMVTPRSMSWMMAWVISRGRSLMI